MSDFAQKSARLPKTTTEKENWKRVIIILEHCPLAPIQSDKGFELLSEKHRNTHAKRKQDPADWRPDVVHQSLLQLLDSPLNRAGRLQVFLRTKKGVCIAVDPRLRVPRNWRLFDKMMTSLLYKMKVRSTSGYLSLLRIVKNPITDHIPVNTKFIRVEKDGALVDMFDFAKKYCGIRDAQAVRAARGTSATSGVGSTVSDALLEAKAKEGFAPFAFVIGGMAKGDVEADYAPKDSPDTTEGGQAMPRCIRIGDRGMSAAAVCSVVLHAFESVWLEDDDREAMEF